MSLLVRWLTVAVLLAQPGEVIDRVLAIVAGDVIAQSDVGLARDLQLVAVEPGSDPTRAILTALIERALVLAEVERYAPPEPAAGDIDGRLQAIRARFPTQEAFEAVLNQGGIDDSHLRERLRHDLRIEAYFAERFPPTGRDALVRDWIAGLRRRTDVIDLYKP